jgi:hypothetical protein
MSKIFNGQYLVLRDERVVQYLGKDADGALKYMEAYMKNNKHSEPCLVQVHAVAVLPPSIITTLAHEVMT